jgi:hypothetical protein
LVKTLFISPGFQEYSQKDHNGDVAGKGKAYRQKLEDEYTEKNYHKPSYKYDAATCKMDSAIKDLKLLYRVGRRLAFETSMLQWKAGSEFNAVREGKKWQFISFVGGH